MDDKEIIELYQKRSENAIKQTSIKYGCYCKTISFNILSDNEDADECVNDTYMNVWYSIPPNIPDSFKAYIAKTVRNISFNKYKYKYAQKRAGSETALILDELAECIPDIVTPESRYEETMLVHQINSFLSNLSADKRAIFVRRYWYNDSIKAIAEKFKLSDSHVKSMLFRCRTKLKEVLFKEGIAI